MRILIAAVGLAGILMSGFIIFKGQFSVLDGLIIILGIYSLAEAFLKKVSVNSEGVLYSFLNKKYALKWNEIKYVGVVDFGSGKKPDKALYFSSKPVDASAINPKAIGNGFIMTLNIEEGIVDEIKKYWKGTINDLNDLK